MRYNARLPLLLRVSLGVLMWCASQIGGAGFAQPPPVLPVAGVHMEGSRMVWQGEMTPAHAADFVRLMKQGNVEGLELRNSPGAGKFAISIFPDVRNVMYKTKLRTYASGYCGSVCASIFLLGQEPTLLRSKTPGVPTFVMYHAVRLDGEVDANLTRTNIADIAKVRGERARHLLLKVVYEGVSRTAALYVFPKPAKTQKGYSTVVFCSGKPGQRVGQCDPLSESAMRDLGVINGV